MRLAIAFLVVVILGVCVSPLPAGQDSCVHRTVPVNTLTEKGRPYAGLTTSDLKASLHGKPVRIVSAQQNTLAPRVMIVIDSSGSMRDKRKDWTLSLSIARALSQFLPADSLVGLVVFSKTIEIRIPPTRDREKLTTELDRLSTYYDSPPRGQHGTALWDALSAIVPDFGSARPGDSIFAITDGRDNMSSTLFDSVKRAILLRGVRIFQFEFNPGVVPTLEERSGGSDMRDLVEASGGYAVTADEPLKAPASGIALNGTSDAELQFALQMRQLLAYYEVEVELPERLNKPQGWKLQAKSPTVGTLQVFYPRTLMPCSVSGAVPGDTP